MILVDKIVGFFKNRREAKIPCNLAECVDHLMRNLTLDQLDRIERDGVDDLNYSLGTWIRTNWDLWDKDSVLHRELLRHGCTDADEMSNLILKSLYRFLTEDVEPSDFRPKMSPAAARKLWAEELRSGKWQQGRAALCKDGHYCCLGVACELAIKDGVRLEKSSVVRGDGMITEYTWSEGESKLLERVWLPKPVQDWLGVKSFRGTLTEFIRTKEGVVHSHLDALNDEGLSFSEIADLIDGGKLDVKS